ncbi:MAG TPA: DUF4170 domain-containing protein [Methylocella sp.]|nr:DUF4170 domain-containing protein [Methylocella sp.]
MTTQDKQLLHFVFGGELTDLSGTEFRDLSNIDIVGIYPDYASALQAWKAKAQATVDNAHMRYFIAHLQKGQRVSAASTVPIGNARKCAVPN